MEKTPIHNEVICGNIGTVYAGPHDNEAHKAFLQYRSMSMAPHGRASGETVTWLRGDDIYKEHQGTIEE